jgi:hypothetical protein
VVSLLFFVSGGVVLLGYLANSTRFADKPANAKKLAAGNTVAGKASGFPVKPASQKEEKTPLLGEQGGESIIDGAYNVDKHNYYEHYWW